MRVRLYRDRLKLEQVLAESERTLTHRTLSLPLLEDAATLHKALEQFSYVSDLQLNQADERELQQRFLHARTTCERVIADGVPRLQHELRYAPPHVQRSIQRLHGSLAPAPDELPGARQQLESYKHELQAIFSGEHIVSDGSLQRQCLRVAELLPDIKRMARSGTLASVLAGELTNYIRRESGAIKMRLAEQLSAALVQYPQKLRAHGKSRLEARELVHLYEQDCVTVERLLDTIIAQSVVAVPDARHGSKELIIGARTAAGCDDLERQLRGYGRIERFRHIPYLALFTDEKQAQELLRRPRSLFNEENSVYEAHPYRVSPAAAAPRAAFWNLELIGAPQAWDVTRGKGSLVAIIDTGVDYTHSDLESVFGSVKGADFVNDSDPYDDNGHGTHVAGSVAGTKTGVAPDATLYAIKVLDASGSGSEVAVLRGIEWAIEHEVNVINMSLGSSYPSDPEAKLVALAAQRGIAVACAAGNDGNSSYTYPASFPGAISVAAIDRFKDRASFSNYNDEVDLCAPGLEVYSTWPGGGYKVLSGTSMATPHVAGACALVRSAGVQSMEERLKRTALSLGRKDYYGSGLLQLAEAVNGT